MKQFFYLLASDQKRGIFVSPLKVCLWLISGVYQILLTTRTFLIKIGILKSHRLAQPVISVGNITWGGTGKTPLVIKIGHMLRERDCDLAILTRGYMGRETHGPDVVRDEAKMLEQALSGVPILVGANRVQNALAHVANNSVDIFLLDDGFQHLALKRNLDIVTIDATCPWGNGHLIPRGILREPLSALKRADLFVLTKTDGEGTDVEAIKNRLTGMGLNQPVLETVHEPVAVENLRSNVICDWSAIRGKKVVSFCSIGDPVSFEETLQKVGAQVVKSFKFLDHHVYTPKDIERIVHFCRVQGIATLVTTQKDAVKLESFLNQFPREWHVFYLEIALNFVSGEEILSERIDDLFQR